jgi:Holliday junction DNA helicase RuvA
VLLPAYVESRLHSEIGQPATLHTIYLLEGSAQGSSMHPRLIGFLSTDDKAFFELFTTVKGIGPRKALRAMTLETGQLAGAIAERDVKLLQSLPEIGKRTAETIIASLHGKVNRFVSGAVYSVAPEPGGAASAPGRTAAREALEVLLQLGESRTQAVQWIDQVLTRDPEIDDAQLIITEAFKVKSGVS